MKRCHYLVRISAGNRLVWGYVRVETGRFMDAKGQAERFFGDRLKAIEPAPVKKLKSGRNVYRLGTSKDVVRRVP